MSEAALKKKEYGLWIAGEEREAQGGDTFTVVNPADGSALASVARGRAEDVDAAVAAARQAFISDGWQNLPPVERSRILYRAARLVRERREELAVMETLDTGKPISQARADADVAARYFEYYAGLADKLGGETIPVAPDILDYTLREPWGVCGVIVPWNYPLQIVARNIAAGTAAGNALVLKPAEEAPLTALELARIVTEAGMPPGIVNVVPGFGPEAGAPLADHPDIDHLHFTGSVETGKAVYAASSRHVRPVSLELGGKSPQIVFADADLAQAVPSIMRGIFQHAGQTCSAGSRLVVERSVKDAVLDNLISRIRRFRLGPGLEDPDMGPVISATRRNEILAAIERAQEEGARVLIGGGAPDDSRLASGFFVLPTVLDDVKPSMAAAQEEIFGPVLSVMTFDTFEEAVALANDTEYGLVAGVWTRDISKAHQMARRLQTGQVFVNTYGAGGGVELPFGGYKKSGFGREKGIEGLLRYTQLKNVCVRIE